MFTVQVKYFIIVSKYKENTYNSSLDEEK